MQLAVYHLKTCDTCRKAIAALTAAGHDLALSDVRADGVPADRLAEIVDMLGFEAVLNTRSTTWRGLSDGEKSDVGRDRALALMAEHPTLIKRPVIIGGDRITVGWSPAIAAGWNASA